MGFFWRPVLGSFGKKFSIISISRTKASHTRLSNSFQIFSTIESIYFRFFPFFREFGFLFIFLTPILQKIGKPTPSKVKNLKIAERSCIGCHCTRNVLDRKVFHETRQKIPKILFFVCFQREKKI